jgi:hypothetical protein
MAPFMLALILGPIIGHQTVITVIAGAWALLGLSFLYQAWDILGASQSINARSDGGANSRAVAHVRGTHLYVNWNVMRNLSERSRVSALEEELFHWTLERKVPFFARRNRAVKVLEEVIVNAAHRVFQGVEWVAALRSQEPSNQLDVAAFISNNFSFVNEETTFQFNYADRYGAERIGLLADSLSIVNIRFLAGTRLRLAEWRRVKDERGGASLEALLLDEPSGEVRGVVRVVGAEGRVHLNVASDPLVHGYVFRALQNWIVRSGLVESPLAPAADNDKMEPWEDIDQDDPAYGTDGMMPGDVQWDPMDELDKLLKTTAHPQRAQPLEKEAILAFLLKNAPQGKLIGPVRASDLESAVLSGYMDVARRQRGLQQKLSAYFLQSYFNDRILRPELALAVVLRPSTAVDKRASVEVYHLNQLGDAAVLRQELKELAIMADLAGKDRSHGIAREIVVAVHGNISAETQQWLSQMKRSFMRIVPVTDGLKNKTGSAYSYAQLLRESEEEAPLPLVAALLNGESGIRFRTFSKMPFQFVADGPLSGVWELFANLSRGWHAVDIKHLEQITRLVESGA